MHDHRLLVLCLFHEDDLEPGALPLLFGVQVNDLHEVRLHHIDEVVDIFNSGVLLLRDQQVEENFFEFSCIFLLCFRRPIFENIEKMPNQQLSALNFKGKDVLFLFYEKLFIWLDRGLGHQPVSRVKVGLGHALLVVSIASKPLRLQVIGQHQPFALPGPSAAIQVPNDSPFFLRIQPLVLDGLQLLLDERLQFIDNLELIKFVYLLLLGFAVQVVVLKLSQVFAFFWLWRLDEHSDVLCLGLHGGLVVDEVFFSFLHQLELLVVRVQRAGGAVDVQKLLDVCKHLVLANSDVVYLILARPLEINVCRIKQVILLKEAPAVVLLQVLLSDPLQEEVGVELAHDHLLGSQLHLVDEFFDFVNHVLLVLGLVVGLV